MTWNEEIRKRLGYMIDLSNDSPAVDPTKKHDFVFLFDATSCNPNGDPDNDNLPRQDFETQKGIVTDVCLKRKIRDFVARTYQTEDHNNTELPFNLFVKQRGLLNKELRETAGLRGNTRDTIENNQRLVRSRYWDVRMFGAVLNVGTSDAPEDPLDGLVAEASVDSTPAPKINRETNKVKKVRSLNGGQCVGPVQIGFASSIESISPQLLSIVRNALVDSKIAGAERAENAMPGSKAYLPYGLYICKGHYSPGLDRDSLVTSLDLALLWNALRQMFELDLSAARPGGMCSLAAWVFSHDHRLGNYPSHRLFEHLQISRNPLGLGGESPARSYQDYTVEMKPIEKNLIRGVTQTTLYNDWDKDRV